MVKCTPLEYQPDSRHIYSDVDYILLGSIVESITGQPLDRYVEESIYHPLSLTRTVFNPLLKGLRLQQVAATELNGSTRDGVIHFPNIRTSILWGQIHDGRAFYSMDGISEHTGLFSNTGNIVVLMQTMLSDEGYDDVQLFSAETVKTFTASSKRDATFGLGWCVDSDAAMTPTFNTLVSPQTYGHTGWTGTMTVIDSVNHMAIMMLNSKSHSSVADPQKNPNMSENSQLPIVTYGQVVDQVYAALKQR